MRRSPNWWVAAALAGGAIVAAPAARGQYRPVVPIVKCFHQGDPVPGLLGVTFSSFTPPQIDGAGNVLLRARMAGIGITSANDWAIWYGPPGAMTMLAREGSEIPGMPGVTYANLAMNAVVAENGTIAFVAYLSGSGVTAGVNDRAAFYGTPGNFVLVGRSGDPVPEVGPGITISGTQPIGVALSDNGTLGLGAQLTGEGLPVTPYHMACWVGTPGALELVAWDGMPAPGCYDCEPGDYLYTTQVDSFNDAGVVTMRHVGRPGGVLR
jgi:hypothetical protein